MSDSDLKKSAYTGRKFFGLSGLALSRMIGFAAGAGFVSCPPAREQGGWLAGLAVRLQYEPRS